MGAGVRTHGADAGLRKTQRSGYLIDMSIAVTVNYKQYSIMLSKEGGENWYIRVLSPGCLDGENGYWSCSDEKTIGEALDETIKVLML
jgi:hypothetical protein